MVKGKKGSIKGFQHSNDNNTISMKQNLFYILVKKNHIKACRKIVNFVNVNLKFKMGKVE